MNNQTQNCQCNGKIKLFSTLATINLACTSKNALCISSDVYIKKKSSILNVTIPMNKSALSIFIPTTTQPNTTVNVTYNPTLGSIQNSFISLPNY